jgi:hypothetical protein
MFSVLMHEYVARVSDQTRTGAPGMARVRTAWPTSNLTYCKVIGYHIASHSIDSGQTIHYGDLSILFPASTGKC